MNGIGIDMTPEITALAPSAKPSTDGVSYSALDLLYLRAAFSLVTHSSCFIGVVRVM